MSEAPPPQAATANEVRCVHCGAAHPVSFAHCPQTGKDITAGEALLGRVIAERYRITGLLGQGGMGAVYVSEHVHTGRKVAIKRLHPELAGDRKAVLRFQREARAAGATGHGHIVEVIDIGLAEDGAPFLAMEYLDGESLLQLLHREGRLTPARACHILGQTLDALDAVHAKGIVHRDLKPDNLFLTRRAGRGDYVKVLDFGVSKVRPEEGEPFDLTLTRTGALVGTPYYMSPEQARGAPAYDHRVDLYAVGVILYQCLSGQLPFDADNYHALLQAILQGQPPDLHEVAPEVPEPLSRLVHRAMASDPAVRFGSAAELLQALVPYGAKAHAALHHAGADVRPTPPAGAAPPPDRRASAAVPTPPPTAPAPPDPDPGRWTGQVPPPRAWCDRPTPFEARSEDWDEGRDSPLGLGQDAPRAPVLTLARSHPTTPTPPIRRGTGAPVRVKGTMVAAALDHLRGQLGGHLPQAMRAAMPSDPTAQPMAWVPLSTYERVLDAAERALGTGDGTIAAELGAAAVRRDFAAAHRPFLLGVTPLAAIRRIPEIWRDYHDGGHVRVAPGTGGSYRLTVEGLHPDTFLHAMAMTGFYRALLELSGARDPRAWLVSSRGRGDARTTTSLRWR
jgi:eukaryotic-like serine/threonine-protein kinase